MQEHGDDAKDGQSQTGFRKNAFSKAFVPLSISLGVSPMEPPMDMFSFIAEVVKATAWPIVTLVIALTFRAQLVALLARLRRGKMGAAEFEFEQEVRDLVQMVPHAEQSTQLGDPVMAIAAGNPRAAILEAWLRLEAAVNRLAFLVDPSHAVQIRSPLQLMALLRKEGIVTEEEADLFKELRSLRNQSTHDINFSPSLESVLRFVQLSNGLHARLSQINPRG